MKIVFVVLMGCFCVFINVPSIAGCYSCGDARCAAKESPCACTDPGWRWDNCMSKGRYCESFGSIGSLDE